jgi:aminocarboxymuconate-semialdehyde decarboxylase
MLIDVHAHQFTAGMLNRHEFWGPFMKAKGLTVGHWVIGSKTNFAPTDAEAEAKILSAMSVDSRMKQMAARGVDKLIVSTPSHAFMYWADEFGDEYARICNDELSAYCKQAPDKLDFWAHANLANPIEAAKEIERAVTKLGAKGLCAGGANFNGLEAYDEKLFPVWEMLTKLDVPVMVHGFNQSIYWGEKHTDDKFETTSIIGDCVDETLFFWNLICGGALDVFPNLKTYICHAGGLALFQLGRLDELNHGMAPDAKNKRRLTDYMPNFYFDLDLHAPSLRRAVLDIVGADRLLYGTNFGGNYGYGDLTAGLDLSPADHEKICSKNAIELLKLAV